VPQEQLLEKPQHHEQAHPSPSDDGMLLCLASTRSHRRPTAASPLSAGTVAIGWEAVTRLGVEAVRTVAARHWGVWSVHDALQCVAVGSRLLCIGT